MTENIHQIAETGVDILVVILLAMVALLVLIYIGYFIFETIFLLFAGVRKRP